MAAADCRGAAPGGCDTAALEWLQNLLRNGNPPAFFPYRHKQVRVNSLWTALALALLLSGDGDPAQDCGFCCWCVEKVPYRRSAALALESKAVSVNGSAQDRAHSLVCTRLCEHLHNRLYHESVLVSRARRIPYILAHTLRQSVGQGDWGNSARASCPPGDCEHRRSGNIGWSCSSLAARRSLPPRPMLSSGPGLQASLPHFIPDPVVCLISLSPTQRVSRLLRSDPAQGPGSVPSDERFRVSQAPD